MITLSGTRGLKCCSIANAIGLRRRPPRSDRAERSLPSFFLQDLLPSFYIVRIRSSIWIHRHYDEGPSHGLRISRGVRTLYRDQKLLISARICLLVLSTVCNQEAPRLPTFSSDHVVAGSYAVVVPARWRLA